MAWNLVLDKDGAALRHDLAENYSGNHGIAREMASGEKLVFLDTVFGVGQTVLVYICFLDKEHGLPMRQELLDIFFVKNF